MIGTIDELEKEIDQFQRNIMASGELVALLGQMLDQLKEQNKSFEQKSDALLSKVDNLPSTIENANDSSNQAIRNEISSELSKSLKDFSDEQNKYLADLELTKKKIQDCMDRSESQEKLFVEEIRNLLDKLDSSITQLRADNTKVSDELKTAIDKTLVERNAEFADEQQKYIDSVQQTEQTVRSAEERLEKVYKEFIDTLEKTNVSNLFEQNQRLKIELGRRTNILTVIAIVGLIIGIAKFFI